MKKVTIVLLGILLAALLSACGTTPIAGETLRSAISVTGNGQVHLTPDLAYIHIGVHSEAPEVADALEENNRQAQEIANKLREMGVADEDIQTTAFNVFPRQEYGPMGEVMDIVYAVDNTVMVTIRDLSSIGSMLDAVVQAGANTINSINFDVQDKDAAYSQARQLAIQNAKMQAEELAQAAGVGLGKVISISAYSSGPIPVYEAKTYQGQGGGTVPIAAGQIVISIDANVSFEIQ